jgi:acyl dehydratase
MTNGGKFTRDELQARVGQELGVSDWFTVTQPMMDMFSQSTCDPDWIHVDPQRAARETPFGGTIAFGFWTLSMLTHFSHEIGMWPKDVAYALNYGLDRVRWISPAPVGSRIRNRCVLLALEARPDDRVLIRTANTIEIEHHDRPALVAEWLGLFVMRADGPPSP